MPQALFHARDCRRRLCACQRSDACRERGFANDRHPTAVRVERFQGLEAEDRRVAERADRPAAIDRAQRVRAVFNHRNAATLRQLGDLVDVARQPPQVRRHDGNGV